MRLKTWCQWRFSKQIAISGLQDTWITTDKQFGDILWFHYELLDIWIPATISINYVKLRQCFLDFKTSRGFPSAWGWVDNDWFFIFGWTIPLSWTTVVARYVLVPALRENGFIVRLCYSRQWYAPFRWLLFDLLLISQQVSKRLAKSMSNSENMDFTAL